MSKRVCVDCGSNKSLLITCRMCDSPDMRCRLDDECQDLQRPCSKCGHEQPGRWGCGGDNGKHLLAPGEKGAKCHICDDWTYCLKHLIKCSCGEDHYFCKDCSFDVRCREEKCNLYFCKNGRLFDDIPETTFCDAHVPRPFKKRLVDLVSLKI